MKISTVSSVVIFILIKNAEFTISELIGMTGQACPGSQLTYTCTIVGAGATVWSGSAFQCPLQTNRITLLHSEFISHSGASGMCNNGAISGRSLRVVNNNFVSQLNVTVSSSLDGKTVQCGHDNGVTITFFGTLTISIATDPLPPPSNVYLSDVNFGQLTFSWNSVISQNYDCIDCQVQYDIFATNCGLCPLTTTNSSVICAVNLAAGQINICTFLLRTVICGSVYGNISNSTSVLVKVPRFPKIHSIPRYSDATQNLMQITSTFEKEESYAIFGGIDGSATSYTIDYFDSITGNTCGSAFIPSSSCKHGTCKHIFEISSSSVSHCLTNSPASSIGVTAFATNILGNGTNSDPVYVVYTNELSRINFHTCTSTTVCTCTFNNEEFLSEKSCSVLYSLDETFLKSKEIRVVENTLNAILIDLPPPYLSSHNIETATFYYIATAANKNYTIEIEGNFSTECMCDINQLLGDSVSLALTNIPWPNVCSSHLHYIGIKNGAICYNSTDVGSVALYFCFSCGQNSPMLSSIRKCQPHGEWNGTFYSCQFECSEQVPGVDMALVLSIGLMGLVITAVTIISVVIIVLLARAKAQLQRSLSKIEDSKIEGIYEDISLSLSHDQSATADTVTRNAAYDVSK